MLGTDATLMMRGLSLSSMEILIPESRTTSCRRFRRSFITPKRGTRIRISFSCSCNAWGSILAMVATGEVSRKGDISELTNRTLFFLTSIGWLILLKKVAYKSNEKFGEYQSFSTSYAFICKPFRR